MRGKTSIVHRFFFKLLFILTAITVSVSLASSWMVYDVARKREVEKTRERLVSLAAAPPHRTGQYPLGRRFFFTLPSGPTFPVEKNTSPAEGMRIP